MAQNEDVGLVVQIDENDFVEKMHFQMPYHDDDSIMSQIVELFQQIASRWTLLLQSLNIEQVITGDESEMSDYVRKLLDGG